MMASSTEATGSGAGTGGAGRSRGRGAGNGVGDATCACAARRRRACNKTGSPLVQPGTRDRAEEGGVAEGANLARLRRYPVPLAGLRWMRFRRPAPTTRRPNRGTRRHEGEHAAVAGHHRVAVARRRRRHTDDGRLATHRRPSPGRWRPRRLKMPPSRATSQYLFAGRR